MFTLADTDSTAAASGILGLGALGTLLVILYGILCFWVPISIYFIDRRVRQMRDILSRMEEVQKQIRDHAQPARKETPLQVTNDETSAFILPPKAD